MPTELNTEKQTASAVEQSEKQTEHTIKLTSAEIASIWLSYMTDTMAICVLGTYLSHVKDREICSVLEFSMQVAQAHVQKLKYLLKEEQHPIPDGFSEKIDTNKDTPRLFTDDFYLFYIQNMGKIGLEFYTVCLSNAARLDICELFTENLSESARLLNKATEIMLRKGAFIRAPYIPSAKKIEYVQKQSYLSGWFSHRRPLNTIEMSNIYFNMIQNQLGRTLLMGFSQVAKSQKVRDYMVRGRDIADKHTEIFGSLLSEDFLPSASAWDTLPTDSTIAPFSDKLMMYHAVMLNADGIAHYGRSLGMSPRADLGANYIRLSAEIAQYAEDGANIMIENGWLEQPPLAIDRDGLATGKK